MEDYVSRGGQKLAGAFSDFGITVENKICADVGASTGGFTDYLLKNGAKKVYAIDVGYGLLEWKLRNDERVEVMERSNVKDLKKLPESVDLVTVDVSFISLRNVLPIIKNWFEKNGDIIALVKPQFESTHKEASKGRGVITDEKIHERVLAELEEFSRQQGFIIKGQTLSPILGKKGGNKEYFLWLSI